LKKCVARPAARARFQKASFAPRCDDRISRLAEPAQSSQREICAAAPRI
jgi:hypothetical protein